MKLDPNHRRTWHATGFAAGLLLATGLVLTPGCGSETPKPPPEASATPAVDAAPTAKTKSKGKPGYEAYDDLKERRAKRRMAAQAEGQ
jgi:hypothetical protein